MSKTRVFSGASLIDALRSDSLVNWSQLAGSQDPVIRWGLKVVKGEASLKYAEFEAFGAEEVYWLVMSRLGHSVGCPCWICLRRQ